MIFAIVLAFSLVAVTFTSLPSIALAWVEYAKDEFANTNAGVSYCRRAFPDAYR